MDQIHKFAGSSEVLIRSIDTDHRLEVNVEHAFGQVVYLIWISHMPRADRESEHPKLRCQGTFIG